MQEKFFFPRVGFEPWSPVWRARDASTTLPFYALISDGLNSLLLNFENEDICF